MSEASAHDKTTPPGSAGVPPVPARRARATAHEQRDPLAGSGPISPASFDRSAGWRSRHYLPHFDQPGLVQTITFRLGDALPAVKLAELAQGLETLDDARLRMRVEAFLDGGHGACYLRNPRVAQIVEEALLYFDGVRYRLLAWVVMPNHVHAVVEVLQPFTLPEIMHSWKSFTAKEANRSLGRAGRFWQREYFDRVIRDDRHLANAVTYIHSNPVKAGLVAEPEAWLFSSAAKLRKTGEAGGAGTQRTGNSRC